MIRIIFSGAVGVMLAVCGCSVSSTPDSTVQATDATPEEPVPSPDIAPAAPHLAFPAQSEPDNDANAGLDAFNALVKAAENNDAEAWARSEKELHALGASATAALSSRLADDNRIARELASMFLAQLGPDAASAATALHKLLDDESTFARVNAAAALSTIDGYAEQVAPVLKGLLVDEDANVRMTAAIALRNVGTLATPAIAQLTRMLGDGDSNVRAAAAETLGKMGPPARQSLSTLQDLVAGDQDREVQTAACRAIRQIDATSDLIPASATE